MLIALSYIASQAHKSSRSPGHHCYHKIEIMFSLHFALFPDFFPSKFPSRRARALNYNLIKLKVNEKICFHWQQKKAKEDEEKNLCRL